jgi:hypothetical protein
MVKELRRMNDQGIARVKYNVRDAVGRRIISL